MHAVCQQRGLLLENCFTFNYAVKCAAHTGDSIIAHYGVGSTNIIIQTFFKDQSTHRYSIDSSITRLIYAKNWKLYITDCSDLHLRVFSQHFNLIQEISLSKTVLSIEYNETTNEIYTGSIGSVDCWELSHQLREPLKPTGSMKCNITKKEWVISLYKSTHSNFLVAGCQNGVYILDCKARNQVNYLPNIHRASISCAVLYHPSQYLITAAMDGTIKVSSSVLNTEFVMSMKPMGHLQEITGLGIHPDYPFLISTSIDGNIRVWDLKSFTEYCSCHFTSPVLALTVTSNGSIMSYCRNDVSSFKLNRVEMFLSSLHSEVESISTVRERNQSALVMTEDGSARLLSATTGLCITIMFPLYTPSLITDIVHNISDNLLYVLTNTGEILIFSTSTNPCSAKQLWFPKSSEECITCITMVQNECHALLVGGHESGSLSVLYNGGYTVPAPYYAHGRSIAQLVSTEHFEISPDNETMEATLATYGIEELIQIWLLKVRLDYRHECWMQKIVNISVSFVPTFMGTTGSCLALTTSDQGVHTLRIPTLVDSSTQVTVIEDPEFVVGQLEDLHCGRITSFSMHQTLNLIATSGEDNRIKVWDYSCDLVAEVNMDLIVSSLSFITRGADLLIGFNEQLGIISGRTLLPLSQLRDLEAFPDVNEVPLQFDHQLEFWYDRTRVPTFPISEASLFNLKVDTRLTPVQQQLLNDVEMEWSSDKIEFIGMVPKLLQDGGEKMAERLIQKGGRNGGGSVLKNSFCRKMKRLSLLMQQDEEDQEEVNLIAVLEDGNFYSEQLAQDETDYTHSNEDRLIPLLAMFSSTKVSMKQISNPSTEHIIAPDGLIPNSVIRKHFKPILPDLMHAHMHNELTRFNVEERIMRKMVSKVKMSKMKHWFTSSSEEDGSSSFSYSPKPRAIWNWDDDDLSFSSGEESKGRRRNKKTRKRESPLSFETDFTSYKNSMATSDMMESTYIFRNRRSRNRSNKLPSISKVNEFNSRPSNLPPTIEDSFESFESYSPSPSDLKIHTEPKHLLLDQSLIKGRSSLIGSNNHGRSPTPPLSTPSLSGISSATLGTPTERNFWKKIPKKQFESSEVETRTITKRVKSTFMFKSRAKHQGRQAKEDNEGEEESEEDFDEDDMFIDEDILLLPNDEESFFNIIDNVKEALLRERSVENIPGVLSADEAFDFIRKAENHSEDSIKPYNSQPGFRTPVPAIPQTKRNAPFVPTVPMRLWDQKKKSVAAAHVAPPKIKNKRMTEEIRVDQQPLQNPRPPSKHRQSIHRIPQPKPKTRLEELLEEISESPWFPQPKSRRGNRPIAVGEGSVTGTTGEPTLGSQTERSQKDIKTIQDIQDIQDDQTGQTSISGRNQQGSKTSMTGLNQQDGKTGKTGPIARGSDLSGQENDIGSTSLGVNEREMGHYTEKERAPADLVRKENLPPNAPVQPHAMSDIQQEPTLDSVLKELRNLLKSANSFVYSQVCHAAESLLDMDCMSIKHKTELSAALALRLDDKEADNSTSIKLNSLKLIEKINVRNPRVIKAVLPLLADKNEKIKETAFLTLNKLTGMSTRNDLQTLMVDIGLLRDTKQDEEEALLELENRLRQKLCRSNSQLTSISFLSNTLSNESSFSRRSSLCNGSFDDDQERRGKGNVKGMTSNPNQATVLQINRLPSSNDSRPFNNTAPPHADTLSNMTNLTQSAETRMRILEMYGTDYHSSKQRNKHLMVMDPRQSSGQSGHVFNRGGPPQGVGSRWTGSQGGTGLQGIGSHGMGLGSHWAGQHALQSVHQRFNRAGNLPAGSHGLQATHRANIDSGSTDQRMNGGGGNSLPPIQPGNNTHQQQQQQANGYGDGLKLPPLRHSRGGPVGLNMPPSIMNERRPSMEMQVMQVQGWAPNHDQFEWGNMNVLLHTKYRESFSDIIWSEKDSPPP